MPPAIGKPFTRSDVEEDAGQESFFSRIPIWVWIAGGIIVLYVLYTKFFSNTSSTSNPAVTTTPDQTGAPYSNLDAALAQVLANEQQITNLIGSGTAPTTTAGGMSPSPRGVNPSSFSPTVNPWTGVPASSNGFTQLGSGAPGLKIAFHGGQPTAPPISSPAHLLRGK